MGPSDVGEHLLLPMRGPEPDRPATRGPLMARANSLDIQAIVAVHGRLYLLRHISQVRIETMHSHNDNGQFRIEMEGYSMIEISREAYEAGMYAAAPPQPALPGPGQPRLTAGAPALPGAQVIDIGAVGSST